MKTVGIPRGLFYYYYYPWYKTFFEDLGAKIILSSPTTRITIDQGINRAVDESCFPIKVYFGHVQELCQYNLDYLFVPRIVSIESRSYICPKFMGVPDMIRASFNKLPPLIDLTIDLSRSQRDFQGELYKTGRLFTKSNRMIRAAYEHGRQELEYCQAIAAQGYTMAEAIDIWQGQEVRTLRDHDLCIGVLGHGYSLYDQTISLDIIGRLRQMGCQVLLPEVLSGERVEKEAAVMPKRIFWTLGRKMVGSAFSLEKMSEVDGLIYVACFGCGPDSFIGEIIERKIKGKPYMLLVIDEHTGEGGLITRLEAFCDMLRRRRRQKIEDDLPAYG